MSGDSAPERLSPNRAQPILRLPYVSGSRGGLLLPRLFFKDNYSILDSFESFFSHNWHLVTLFRQNERHGLIDPHVLLTLLSLSLWQTNLRLLKTDIENVSFIEMRKQTRLRRGETSLVNDRLHDRREDLEFLRREIQYLRKWITDEVKVSTETARLDASYDEQPVDATLNEVLSNASVLQSFLMDTFQLWMAILRFENTLLNLDQVDLNNQIATDNGNTARSSEIQAREAVRQADANNKILAASNKLAQASEARSREAVQQAKASHDILTANNAILETNNRLVTASVEQARASNQLLDATRSILEANNRIAADGEQRADESTRQTSRATALTFLAALYLPMTLASGLFGMNIREISESNLATLNQFVGTLVALVASTVVAMLVYLLLERHKARKQRRVSGAARADPEDNQGSSRPLPRADVSVQHSSEHSNGASKDSKQTSTGSTPTPRTMAGQTSIQSNRSTQERGQELSRPTQSFIASVGSEIGHPRASAQVKKEQSIELTRNPKTTGSKHIIQKITHDTKSADFCKNMDGPNGSTSLSKHVDEGSRSEPPSLLKLAIALDDQTDAQVTDSNHGQVPDNDDLYYVTPPGSPSRPTAIPKS